MRNTVISKELNRLYAEDRDKYQTECTDLKRMGYRIFRNSEGLHKVEEPIKEQDMDIYSAFGGVFGDIFRGEK